MSLRLLTTLHNTTFYIIHVLDWNDFDNFDFETAETKWMTCEEFQQIGRDIHRPVVELANKLIPDNGG